LRTELSFRPQPRRALLAAAVFAGAVLTVPDAALAEGLFDFFFGAQKQQARQASPQAILKVDLYGTALVLEEFGNVIAPGGAGVVIASQSGHRLPPLSVEQNKALATTPVEELLQLPMLQSDQVEDSLHAYQLSKRGNSLRVMAEAVRWGARGARVNTISPGHHHAACERRTARPAWRRLPANDRDLGGRTRRHAGRSGNRRRSAHGPGWRLHYRQRCPHGWWGHRGVLVR